MWRTWRTAQGRQFKTDVTVQEERKFSKRTTRKFPAAISRRLKQICYMGVWEWLTFPTYPCCSSLPSEIPRCNETKKNVLFIYQTEHYLYSLLYSAKTSFFWAKQIRKESKHSESIKCLRKLYCFEKSTKTVISFATIGSRLNINAS